MLNGFNTFATSKGTQELLCAVQYFLNDTAINPRAKLLL